MKIDGIDRRATAGPAVLVDRIRYREAPAWNGKWAELSRLARRARALPILIINVSAGCASGEPLALVRLSDLEEMIRRCGDERN